MMSSLPNSRTAVCAIFSGKSGAVTLPTQAVATPPDALIELTTPSAVSPSRSLTTTCAPCSANSVATARPIPRPEPVTIADLPSSNFILVLILSEKDSAKYRQSGFTAEAQRTRRVRREKEEEESSGILSALPQRSQRLRGELTFIPFLEHEH